MKKSLLPLMLLIVSLLTSSCGPSLGGTVNTLSVSKLNEREKMLLSLSGTQSFAFDFTASEEYKWVQVWVDRYEKGVLIDSTGRLCLNVDPGTKGMLVVAMKEKENGVFDWTYAISSGGAAAKGESMLTVSPEDDKSLCSSTSIRSGDIEISDQDITLAGISYNFTSAEGGSFSALTEESLSDLEEHLDELKESDVVFVVKCGFSKNLNGPTE